MDTDKSMGALIVIGVIVAGVLYFMPLLNEFVAISWLWKFKTAVQVVVSIGFVMVLGVAGWIGWTMLSTPSPEPIEDLDMDDLEEETPELEETEEVKVPEGIEEKAEKSKEFREKLTSIKGLTDSRVDNLMDAGYRDLDSLKAATVDDLKQVKGIGSATAERIKENL